MTFGMTFGICANNFLDNVKEYPALTSKEATAAYYKTCSSSVCEHNDKSKKKATKPTQKFDEDAY